MAKTVLVVDDEPRIRRMIAKYLVDARYRCLEARDGQEALSILRDEPVDLVVLDMMMPRMDGESTLRQLRAFSDVYVIVLTARTGEDAQVSAYALGADDYIEKPFGCKALLSKIHAIFARLDQKAYGKQIAQVNGLVCDTAARKAYLQGRDCELKPKEFDLLHYLLLNQNVALTREQILNGVWGSDYFGADRTVDSHISNLRRKLGDMGGCIRTLTGRGYRFEVPS